MELFLFLFLFRPAAGVLELLRCAVFMTMKRYGVIKTLMPPPGAELTEVSWPKDPQRRPFSGWFWGTFPIIFILEWSLLLYYWHWPPAFCVNLAPAATLSDYLNYQFSLQTHSNPLTKPFVYEKEMQQKTLSGQVKVKRWTMSWGQREPGPPMNLHTAYLSSSGLQPFKPPSLFFLQVFLEHFEQWRLRQVFLIKIKHPFIVPNSVV